ncbi:MAG: type II toxin-antitoxin system HicA family toxin [Gemmataceae bacterium]|nr:type II toxin-antitoxin system HicA family toxin [Gemmataceae bacterium]
MPKKIRQLKSLLKKAGFSSRPGKGSHTVWSHLRLKRRPVVLSGNDADDAHHYQEQQVRAAIREVEGDA